MTTLQRALNPQEPTQGSLHFEPIHASRFGQSACIRHSGLQFGGAPNMPGRQEQTGRWSTTRHWELPPQGEGMQGFSTSTGTFGTVKQSRYIYYFCLKKINKIIVSIVRPLVTKSNIDFLQ